MSQSIDETSAINTGQQLPLAFYQSDDVVRLAQALLGKFLFTRIDGLLTGGMIVETEAYKGVIDKASHAYGDRHTERTKVMYEEGGLAYVYFCYGIHYLFNVVTAVAGTPHAVLIRAIEPTEGIDVMLLRRNMPILKNNITKGPGSVAKALGIDKSLNAASLLGDTIWIADKGIMIGEDAMAASPRIGVDYAAEHAQLPWRFHVKGNKYVSGKKNQQG